MKKLALLAALVSGMFLISCGDDDDNPACLECTSDDPDLDITGGNVCVGDEVDGQTITRQDLNDSRDILEAFGANCTIN